MTKAFTPSKGNACLRNSTSGCFVLWLGLGFVPFFFFFFFLKIRNTLVSSVQFKFSFPSNKQK